MKGSYNLFGKYTSGFTLVELVITTLILLLLISVVANSYGQYVQKSRRSDATSTILKLVAEQEFYFSKFRSYTTKLKDLNHVGDSSDNEHYSMRLTDCGLEVTRDCYVISAVAVNGSAQFDDKECRIFSFNSATGQESKNSSNEVTTKDCWAK